MQTYYFVVSLFSIVIEHMCCCNAYGMVPVGFLGNHVMDASKKEFLSQWQENLMNNANEVSPANYSQLAGQLFGRPTVRIRV